MDGPSDEIDLEAFLPRGFEHRNSEDDLWDLALALESGDEDGAIRKLTDRWTQEDEKNREIARERKKQQFRDRQMAQISGDLKELKSGQFKQSEDPEVKSMLVSVKAFLERAKKSSAHLPTYMNKSQLADFLDVAEKTVDKLVRAAVIPAPKIISEDPQKNKRGRKIQRWKTEEVIHQIDQH